MRGLQLIERDLHFRAPSQDPHASVAEIVVVAEPLPLLQVSSRCFRGSLCRNHISVVANLVLQLAPLDVQSSFVGFFAQRRLLKNFINLCALGKVWFCCAWLA